MNLLSKNNGYSLYETMPTQEGASRLRTFLVSTPETRSICNDPRVMGVEYTDKLKTAMEKLFVSLKEAGVELGEEKSLLILNILRGGLNFGLRDALHTAYGWNKHRSAFISSQRAYDEKEGWHVTENRYQKIPLMEEMDLLFADVVATGVSLEHATTKLVELCKETGKKIRRVTFITIGGERAHEIMTKIDALCRSLWADYQGTNLIFIEGIFGVAEEGSHLNIAIPGTDLLRHPALLTPEFIDAQKEALPYALERCTIYDAGSRAYDVNEYLEDVKDYWQKVHALGEKGLSVRDYLEERFPEDTRLKDAEWCEAHGVPGSLTALAVTHWRCWKEDPEAPTDIYPANCGIFH